MWPLVIFGAGLLLLTGYQSKQLADKLECNLKDISIVKKGINIFSSSLILEIELKNPTSGSIKISSLSGSVMMNKLKAADFFNNQSFVIPANENGGKVLIKVNAVIDNKAFLKTLLSLIATKKTPDISINLKIDTLGTSFNTVIPFAQGREIKIKDIG